MLSTPHLQSLRLDSPYANVTECLGILPNLTSLEISYYSSLKPGGTPVPMATPLARLRYLTVHLTHSYAPDLWPWIAQLVPHRGSLQSLRICNRVPFAGVNLPTVPTGFLSYLAKLYGNSLRELLLENLTVSKHDIFMICTSFSNLTILSFRHLQNDLVSVLFTMSWSQTNSKTILVIY